MTKSLVDLLWRDHPAARPTGTRGPKARHSVTDVVERASELADKGGVEAVTVRALAESLGMSAMSLYTHVNSRDDLLVLMADQTYRQMPRISFGRAGWGTRIRQVAEANLDLLRAHPWLLDLTDPRAALGPGTIAKYDNELQAFDKTGLTDVDRDAALTFVLDFVRSSARAIVSTPAPEGFGEVWADSNVRLAGYLGDDFPLAQTVGRAAGEAIGSPYDARRAWDFGLERVIAGLTDLIEPG